MTDVAIIGVGLHPFGRFEGKSAMDMGAEAVSPPSPTPGQWKDIQFAIGGSWTVANPDAVVGMVGLTGIPFINVFNGCATAAGAAKACADAIRRATTTSASPSGWTSTRAAPSPATPRWGTPHWYGENGQFLTTKFFAMKINRYMDEHGISRRRWRRWRRRTSATARSTRTRSGASPSPRRRSWRRRC